MDRQQLIQKFSHIAPVKNIGQSYRHSNVPYIVLKAMENERDSGNRFGGFQRYNLLCYAPDTSTKMLDDLVTAVKNRVFELQEEGIEYTGSIGEDFHDTEINMYMRYVGIRVPHQANM